MGCILAKRMSPSLGQLEKNRKILLASYSFWFALKTRRVTLSSLIFNLAKGSSGRQAPASGNQREGKFKLKGVAQRNSLSQVLLHPQQ